MDSGISLIASAQLCNGRRTAPQCLHMALDCPGCNLCLKSVALTRGAPKQRRITHTVWEVYTKRGSPQKKPLPPARVRVSFNQYTWVALRPDSLKDDASILVWRLRYSMEYDNEDKLKGYSHIHVHVSYYIHPHE